MEIVGIALSVPVALVMNFAYCFLIAKTIARSERISRRFRIGSILVLGLFIVEIVLLATLGAARSRDILGGGFYAAHLAIFFLGPPALANVLVLRKCPGRFGRWYAAAPVCAAFAFILVLLQYGVSEALFGVDGSG